MAQKRLVWQRGDKLENLGQLSRDASGVAVTITNNYHQTAALSRLDGTATDGDKMEKAFEFFGFVCIRARNLLADDIKELVETVTKCEGLASCKCIAFVFSGHGLEGGILGEDGEIIDAKVEIDEEIIQPFADAASVIPKLFFIDACRGGGSISSGKGTAAGAWRPGLSKGDRDSSSVPSAGNYIIGYATMTGYKSYLRSDNEEGSVWMPLLADELQRNPDRDVLNVLQDVNARLTKDYETERIQLDSFQQPHFESTCPGKVNLFKISGLKESKGIKRPTMNELIGVRTKGGQFLRVIKQLIACGFSTCEDFAQMLLKDELSVKSIKSRSKKDENEFLRAVFQNWLSRNDDNHDDPAYPRTWLALAYCLEYTDEVELGTLVKAIRDYAES